MLDALLETGVSEDKRKRLSVTEASLLDLSDDELERLVDGTDGVVSCLGHNMDFKGLFGQPRRLVTDATRRLTTALTKVSEKNKKPSKFVLMGSEGVAHPDGKTDDLRNAPERTIIFLLRYLIPPHADNEQAASYLYNTVGTSNNQVEWVVIRPTDLIDAPDASEYVLLDKPKGSLFGSGATATRANVAKSMVDLLADEKMWNKYKYRMPVLHDAEGEGAAGEKKEGGGEL